MPGVEPILDAKEPGLETLLQELSAISDAISSTYFGVTGIDQPREPRGESAS